MDFCYVLSLEANSYVRNLLFGYYILRVLLVGYDIEFEMFWLLRKFSDRLDGAKGLIWDLKG